MIKESIIKQSFDAATERYAALGVDTKLAMDKLQKISLSLHCWQADDVTGFENQGGSLTGGIQVTGNYPGRARTIEELRADVLKAASMNNCRVAVVSWIGLRVKIRWQLMLVCRL